MSLAAPPPTLTPRRRRFTLAEWHRAGETGLFRPDERLELRHGEVIEMSPMGTPHTWRVAVLSRLLMERLSSEAGVILIQLPIVLIDDTEPLPDVAILRPESADDQSHRPGAADVLLLIEIADSSLMYDLGPKAADYAASGIPEYWVIDLSAREVVVHTDPRPNGTWGTIIRRATGAALTPINFPSLALPCELIVGK